MLKREELPKMYLLELMRLCGSVIIYLSQKYGKVARMFE
jgi:hypothetical protein